MKSIVIRERPGSPAEGGAFAAEVSIDDDVPFAVTVPPPATAEDEKLLEWYFEEHLRFPFADHDRAKAARASIAAYGEALFRALFDDRDLYARYREAIRPGLHQLAIEVMGGPEFQSLHWEALKDPNLPRALALDVPLVRRRLAPQTSRALVRPAPAINILLVTARPHGGRDVGYRTISRPLVEALRQAEVPANIEILRPGTYRALYDHLEQVFTEKGAGHYHVLHLDVHGALLAHDQLAKLGTPDRLLYRYGRDEIAGFAGRKAFLFLEGDDAPDPVEAQELADLLNKHQIPIAILNACQSGKQVGAEETSLGSRLMDAGAQLVLAMSYSVTVSAATLLMTNLYQRLLAGDTLATAIRRGRAELANHKSRQAYFNQTVELEDWLLPVVYQNQPVQLQPRAFTPEESRAYYERRANRYPEPATAYGFVGRDLDILEIERRLLRVGSDGRCRNLLLVRGMGGAGKTTLLHHLGSWWQTTGFVDEVFYFGYDQRAWTAGQIQAALARKLLGEARYHAEFVPLSEPAQLQMLASRLRAQRHLLILDNLESITGAELAIQNTLPETERAALMRFLGELAGGRSLVLLGSRGGENWLAPGSFGDNHYELGGLDPEAASNLAERILERKGAAKYRTDPQLRELMRLLAGYPLALEVVLANLARQTPMDLLEALRAGDVGLDHGDARDKTKSLLRCIEYSHGNLSADAQDLLGCLAPFAGVVFEPLLKQYSEHLKQQPALASLPFEHWAAVLEEARNWGLLSPHGELRGFLTLQPVLPYFLRSRWAGPEKVPLKAAVEAAFCELYGGAAGQIIRLQGSKAANERHLGLILAQTEYENLHTALFLAIAQGRSILHPYLAMSKLFDVRQEQKRGLELGTAVLKALDAPNLPRPSGQRMLEVIGVIDNIAKRQLVLKQYDDARTSYRRALELHNNEESLELANKQRLSASIYHQLGMVAQKQRRWEEAEQHYQKALEIKIQFNDYYGQASTKHQLGVVALEQRRWEEAEQHYRKALEIYAEFADHFEQAGTYHQLGRVMQDQRRWEEAEQHYRKALEIKIQFNDHFGQSSTYHQLGRVAQEQQRWEEAEQHYRKALEIKIQFDERYEQASTYHQLGIVAQEQQRWEEAAQHFLRALETFHVYQDQFSLSIVLRSTARLWTATGNTAMLSSVATILEESDDEIRDLFKELSEQSQ